MPEFDAIQGLVQKWQSKQWSSVPEEINSGAITSRGPNEFGEEEFCIETNSSACGRRKFVGTEEGDPQSNALRRAGSRALVRVWKSKAWARIQLDDVPRQDPRRNERVSSPTELLHRLLNAEQDELPHLVCEAEAFHFESQQRGQLASLLWHYIQQNRDAIDSKILTAVGSAIRKYVAMLDANRVAEICSLFESGHRAPLPLELELELVKMIYRKFEANPPAVDPQPELSARLWELAQDYMRPRIMLRDKHATVASLAIEAIVAMRSPLGEPAVAAALATPYSWFGEMVADNLARLCERWRPMDRDAAQWCANLVEKAVGQTIGGMRASSASR